MASCHNNTTQTHSNPSPLLRVYTIQYHPKLKLIPLCCIVRSEKSKVMTKVFNNNSIVSSTISSNSSTTTRQALRGREGPIPTQITLLNSFSLPPAPVPEFVLSSQNETTHLSSDERVSRCLQAVLDLGWDDIIKGSDNFDADDSTPLPHHRHLPRGPPPPPPGASPTN